MKKILIFSMLILLIFGCSHITVETLPITVTDNSGKPVPIIVLPFSDYSNDDFIADRSAILMASLNSALIKYGFMPLPYEDIFAFLLERGVIKSVAVKAAHDEKFLNDYSKMMKDFVQEVYKSERQAPQKFIPLDEKLLLAMKDRFKSRYVLRGRVIEMGTKKAESFNPAQTGVLPFIFKTGSRVVFGVGSTDTYELVDKLMLGAVLGSGLAQERYPLDPKRFKLKDQENIKDLNRGIWAAGGPGLAWMSHGSGDTPAGIVHMEMLLQDTATGMPIWANRIRVDVTPESVFYTGDRDSLLKVAIERAVERLIEDLTKTFNARS